ATAALARGRLLGGRQRANETGLPGLDRSARRRGEEPGGIRSGRERTASHGPASCRRRAGRRIGAARVGNPPGAGGAMGKTRRSPRLRTHVWRGSPICRIDSGSGGGDWCDAGALRSDIEGSEMRRDFGFRISNLELEKRRGELGVCLILLLGWAIACGGIRTISRDGYRAQIVFGGRERYAVALRGEKRRVEGDFDGSKLVKIMRPDLGKTWQFRPSTK